MVHFTTGKYLITAFIKYISVSVLAFKHPETLTTNTTKVRTKSTGSSVGLQMSHFYFLVQHHNKQFSHEVFKGIFFSC